MRIQSGAGHVPVICTPERFISLPWHAATCGEEEKAVAEILDAEVVRTSRSGLTTTWRVPVSQLAFPVPVFRADVSFVRAVEQVEETLRKQDRALLVPVQYGDPEGTQWCSNSWSPICGPLYEVEIVDRISADPKVRVQVRFLRHTDPGKNAWVYEVAPYEETITERTYTVRFPAVHGLPPGPQEVRWTEQSITFTVPESYRFGRLDAIVSKAAVRVLHRSALFVNNNPVPRWGRMCGFRPATVHQWFVWPDDAALPTGFISDIMHQDTVPIAGPYAVLVSQYPHILVSTHPRPRLIAGSSGWVDVQHSVALAAIRAAQRRDRQAVLALASAVTEVENEGYMVQFE